VLVYHLNKATSTTYARRGGASGNSFGCGFVFADLSNTFGAANWHFGAAISFKPFLFIVIIFINLLVLNILFVVVILAVVPIVGISMLVLTLLLLIPPGPLVLLYHLNFFSFYCDYFYQSNGNRYTMRGSCSDGSFIVGVFSLYMYQAYSYSYKLFGANISFK
jgi:hypothetical protein